jgi:hypothetical protein
MTFCCTQKLVPFSAIIFPFSGWEKIPNPHLENVQWIRILATINPKYVFHKSVLSGLMETYRRGGIKIVRIRLGRKQQGSKSSKQNSINTCINSKTLAVYTGPTWIWAKWSPSTRRSRHVSSSLNQKLSLIDNYSQMNNFKILSSIWLSLWIQTTLRSL